MFLGEVRRVDVELFNCGQTSLTNLRLASTCPDLFTFTCNAHLQQHPHQRDVTHVERIPLSGGRVRPGESQVVTMWLCATAARDESAHALSQHSCVIDAQFLFCYDSEEKNPRSSLKSVESSQQSSCWNR